MENVHSGEYLSIKDVLGNSVELSNHILYAKYIKKSDFSHLFSDLKTKINSNKIDIDRDIESIENNLKSTNSKRFYNGEEAQKEISELKNIDTTLGDLDKIVTSINNNLEEIANTIDRYNKNLKELKKGARFKLLKQTADAYNKKRIRKGSKYKAVSSNVNISEGDYPYSFEHPIAAGTLDFPSFRVCDTPKSYDVYKTNVTYTRQDYDFINYWCWFTGESFPFNILDDNVEALENKILSKGESLPYEKHRIIE